MSWNVSRAALVGAILSLNGPAPAAEPAPAEPLPVPRKVLPEAIPLTPEFAFPAYPRASRYDVWQFYGVDRYGNFRPRVVYSPYGSYYLYNGAPYPWAPTRQMDFMPYVTDSPSGALQPEPPSGTAPAPHGPVFPNP
jgi:hypothetical protein